jgi:hypothetical protein
MRWGIDMGTAEVGRFDLRAVASDLAHVMEYGRRGPKPFPDVRIRLAQPFGILEERDSNDDDEHGRCGLALHPGFASVAPGSNDATAIIPKVITLSTG